MDAAAITHVGVILVHGVGEQRRFEHLDWQGREIINALLDTNRGGDKANMTVEIEAPAASMFHAEQATWADDGRGAVQVVVAHGGKVTHRIHIHEIWWADVNESYSLPKQVRFWMWGLALWAFPGGKGGAASGTLHTVTAPKPPGRDRTFKTALLYIWARLRMFGIAVIFALGGLTVGVLFTLVQRLMGLRRMPILPIVTNYLSAVKLFIQKTRHAPGLVTQNQDFLDTLELPPRVSVRRRVIRTIAQVALQPDYQRWYIVAHSQGTVAAFNGLMESPDAWSGYFTEAQWQELRDATPPLCGPPRESWTGQPPPEMPPRPAWNGQREVAYRARIFGRFAGLLTLGSPLAKFAAIWPARVPVSLMPAFQPGTFWINVFDPIDPIAGLMTPFDIGHPALCPTPVDLGYCAYPVLLLAHLRYLTRRGEGTLAAGVAQLLLDGSTRGILQAGNGRFQPWSAIYWFRTVMAWLSWCIVLAFLLALAVLGLGLAEAAVPEMWDGIVKLAHTAVGTPPPTSWMHAWSMHLHHGWAALRRGVGDIWMRDFGFLAGIGRWWRAVIIAVGLPIVAGIWSRLRHGGDGGFTLAAADPIVPVQDVDPRSGS